MVGQQDVKWLVVGWLVHYTVPCDLPLPAPPCKHSPPPPSCKHSLPAPPCKRSLPAPPCKHSLPPLLPTLTHSFPPQFNNGQGLLLEGDGTSMTLNVCAAAVEALMVAPSQHKSKQVTAAALYRDECGWMDRVLALRLAQRGGRGAEQAQAAADKSNLAMRHLSPEPDQAVAAAAAAASGSSTTSFPAAPQVPGLQQTMYPEPSRPADAIMGEDLDFEEPGGKNPPPPPPPPLPPSPGVDTGTPGRTWPAIRALGARTATQAGPHKVIKVEEAAHPPPGPLGTAPGSAMEVDHQGGGEAPATRGGVVVKEEQGKGGAGGRDSAGGPRADGSVAGGDPPGSPGPGGALTPAATGGDVEEGVAEQAAAADVADVDEGEGLEGEGEGEVSAASVYLLLCRWAGWAGCQGY